MTQRSTLRRLWAGLITALFLAWAPGSQAAPTLIWLLRDLPPLTVFHGPQKGKGIVDQVMPALIAGMPQYQHVIMRVNRARALQMLEEPSLTCDPALIWNPARALSIVYSEPVAIMHSNGMAILRENQHLIEPFVHDDKVDLPGLLKAQTLKLGVIAKRSYGVLIDSQLKLSPPGQIVMHYGNDPLGSLLQMQHAGRMPTLLGYWPEIQAKASQQGLSSDELLFYPIQGAPEYQSIYVGCSDTAQGREVIRRFNSILTTLGSPSLSYLDEQ
ncbi:TIGR02285 family protein [Pseudomonas sp. FSL R10-2964]|uniref:TIGR02285 family protein n=1 Tax=Pseudomonas sp. FSL R10-2964 TaxID=2662202 RepID=UPI001298186F|nr:TIGR02285 family protein [Pseudomonas sp. FSL R10-2964]MQT83197.1 TIGR02285 family protein [Pseudomonas sp. FSL R10-2964]